MTHTDGWGYLDGKMDVVVGADHRSVGALTGLFDSQAVQEIIVCSPPACDVN